ncbi:hypothetical protein TWF718_006661 [Orbilia javanica]|uniref:Uncharacterized protein n=1 Tax=Orbilia javanica TaxID=47235 RepID=A0AAN8N5P4_9PEZI
MASIQDIEVIRCSVSAFYSEHSKTLTKAQSLHEAAVIGLKAIAEDSWHEQEIRTICDRQAEFHASRYHLIRSILDGSHGALPFILPTTLSAEESINSTLKDRGPSISLEESLLAEYLAGKEEDPNLAVPARISHLLDPATLPPYIRSLDSNLPPKQYKVTIDMDSTNYTYWLNAHPLDQPDQTCYRLRANRWGKTQFDSVEFYRATEFIVPCIDIKISSVASTGDKNLSAMKSRPIKYTPSNSSRSIIENPDSLEKRTWGSQKFEYGGRSFMWITPEGKGDMQLPVLSEIGNGVDGIVGSTRNAGSKSGNELCWGDFKPGKDAFATIGIVGGVDQLFEELLLAGQMTKMAIFLFGHDI